MSDYVRFELNDGIATITLNRPAKLNAFTPDMLDGLLDAYAECRDHPDIRVAVLTGAGRGFCSGGDRALIQGLNIDLRAHLDQVSSHIAVAHSTEDHVEAIAALREKRAPLFKGK